MKKLLALPLTLFLLATPAKAQWAVFDPANLAQAVQNGAQMYSQLKTAKRQLDQLRYNVERFRDLDLRDPGEAIYAVDRVLAAADGFAYTAARIDEQFDETFPEGLPDNTTSKKIRQTRETMNTLRGTLRSLSQVAAQVEGIQHDMSRFKNRLEGADTPQKTRQVQGSIAAYQVSQMAQLRQSISLLTQQQTIKYAYEMQQRRQTLLRGRATLRAMQNVQNPTTERFDGTWSFTN